MAKTKQNGKIEIPTNFQEPKESDIKPIVAKTDNQKIYIRSIVNNDITIVTGCAGTGKSTVAVGLAVEYLNKNKIDKIVLVRPAISAVGEDIGFLPGTFQEKLDPFLAPLFDGFSKFTSPEKFKSWMKEGKIEIVPLSFIRGRTFERCFIIVDEAQNLTLPGIKTVITRMGVDSKLVINGDYQQSDLPLAHQGALKLYAERLCQLSGIGVVHLEEIDIQRHPLIGKILRVMDGLELKDLEERTPRKINDFLSASTY